jgi:hypothetical protein
LRLGYPSPRHLQAELTSEDILYWRAYSILEPWGDTREDFRMGLIASILFNSNRGKDVDPKMWYHFFPNVDAPEQAVAKPHEPQTKEELEASCEAAISAFKAWNMRFEGKKTPTKGR